MVLNERSEERLRGVHPKLVAVVRRAAELTQVDFIVTEGLRTEARQRQLVAKGASRTMNSRHLTGHAVDLAAVIDGDVRWDWPLYYKLADAMKAAAAELDVPVRWGGTWKQLAESPSPIDGSKLSKSFPDGPHFEIPPDRFPL